MINSGICRLAELIDRLRRRNLSAEEEEAARLCLLDTLSCSVYGSSMPEAALFVRGVRDMGAAGGIPLWGSGELFGVENAALLEGAFCHLRELDDVHYAIVHTGSVCVPTAFSMALKQGATLRIGSSILLAATLSFLGLGAQPPTPEWGAMLNAARAYIWTAPYLAIFPGLAITITVVAVNLLGDALRDYLDPRTRNA